MAEIPVVIKLLAERTGSVEAVLRDTQSRFDALAGSITAIGARASVALGAMSAGLVAVGASVVRTAGEFEQLQAKLTSALGSSEKAAAAFASTLKFAASTPFDVQGLVQATVTLEAFQQRSQTALPLAANLAAAFGQRVQDSALVLGKALSGSLEGFESLRNNYAITTVELRKFGAETTNTGGIAVRTAGQLEKARQALAAIIQTRYGDATARQSATLFGALSNLGDAFSRVAAGLGQELVPAITTITRALTGAIEAFERIPGPMRQALVIGGTLAAGLLGIGSAVAGLATVLVTGGGYMVAFAAALAKVGPAVPTVAGGLSALAAGAGALATGIQAATLAGLAFLATPLGAALLVIAGTAVGVGVALAKLHSDNAALNKSIEEQSRRSIQAASDWRAYSAELERATGVSAGFLSSGKGLASTADLVAQALQNVTLADFARNLSGAGIGLDDLRKKLDETRSGADKSREDMRLLAEALREVQSATGAPGQGLGSAFGAEGVLDADKLQRVKELLGGGAVTAANMEQALASMMTQARSTTGATTIAIQGMIDKLTSANTAFDEASASAQTFGTYLQIATKTDNLDTLRTVLADTSVKLQEVAGKLASTGIQTSNLGELQKRLLTAGEGEKKAITEYLKLLDQQEALQGKIAGKEKGALAGKEKGALSERFRQIEETAERKKLLGKEDLAAEQAALTNLANQQGVDSQLGLQILRRQNAIKGELRQQDVGAARESFQAATLAARESIDDVRTNGTSTSREVAQSITGVLGSLRAWESANAAVLAQSPELRSSYASTYAGFEKDLKRAKAAIPKEEFDELLRASKDFGAEATTTPTKLAATKQAIDLLTTALDKGLITTRQEQIRLDTELTRLGKEKLTLEQQLAKETDAELKKTQDVRLKAAEQELGILEQRAAAGDRYAESQVKATKEDILAAKIQQIRDLEKQEIDSGNRSTESIQQAHERAQLRITALQNEELSKRIAAQRKEGDAAEQETNRILDLRNRLKGEQANRVGGAASPLQSLAEVGLESALRFSGGPGNRAGGGLGGGGSLFGGENRRLSQVKASVGADFANAERNSARRASGADQALARTPADRSGPSVVNQHVTNNLSLPQLRGTGVERAAESLGQEVVKADRQRLLASSGAPEGVK